MIDDDDDVDDDDDEDEDDDSTIDEITNIKYTHATAAAARMIFWDTSNSIHQELNQSRHLKLNPSKPTRTDSIKNSVGQIDHDRRHDKPTSGHLALLRSNDEERSQHAIEKHDTFDQNNRIAQYDR